MGDVVHTYSIFEFTVALCYLILHEFEDDNGKLSNVQIRSFVDAYEKQYKTLNDLELSIVHVIILIVILLFITYFMSLWGVYIL